MPGKYMSVLAVVFVMVAGVTAAATDEVIMVSLNIQDNRILDVDGNYTFDSGQAHSCTAFIDQLADSTISAQVTIVGAPTTQIVSAKGALKGGGSDGMTLSLKGTNSEGWGVTITGNFTNAPGHFDLVITIKGPGVDLTYPGTLIPADTSRGMIINNRHMVDGEPFYDVLAPDFTDTDAIVSISRQFGISKVKIKSSRVSCTFKCNGGGTDAAPLFSGTAGICGKAKIGKLKLLEHQIRLSFVMAPGP